MQDSIFTYGDEEQERILDMLEVGNMTSEEDSLAAVHWSNEAQKWWKELEQWKRFKEAQRIHNQSGRTKRELELENTDVELVEALSKLNDWQEFEELQQHEVYEAEWLQEQCQQRITVFQNATVGASGAELRRESQAPWDEWIEQMEKGQKRLEASEEKLMWVKGQWPEVLEEACQLIAAASPELQKQLENKFEKQTNAMYSWLRLFRGRPSHPIYPPDEKVGLAQRLDHWISETSGFTAELREWKYFLDWRREHVQEETSQTVPRPRLLKDLVKYRQYKLYRATGWADCWRQRARQLTEAEKSTSLPENSVFRNVDDEDDEFDEDFQYWQDALACGFEEVTEGEQAGNFASEAEETVSIAAKRLDRAKQELEVVLAKYSRIPRGGGPAVSSGGQLPQSAEKLPKNQKTSHKNEKGHRRSKKKEARKSDAKTGNTNTKQQALPAFSPNPNQVNETDEIEMSDVPESSRLVEAIEEVKEEEIEDTAMPDVEDHKPTTNTISRKMPSPSRKTSSAPKLNQPLSGRIPKNKNKDNKKPGKKAKTFTEQQTMLLLNAASTSCPPTDPTALLDATSTSCPPTDPTALMDVASTNYPPTNPTALLDAASISNPPTDPTPLESIPPRRSERLNKKVATPAAVVSPPQSPIGIQRSLKAVQFSRVSKLKKGKMRAGAVGL